MAGPDPEGSSGTADCPGGAVRIVAMSDELFHPWTPGFHHDALEEGMREAAEIALDAVKNL